MTRDQITATSSALQFAALFEALPGSCILLQNDAPRYTILAATPGYLAQTGTTKEYLIGKGVFEAFPPNPGEPSDTGTHDVRASLEQVRLKKEPHQLPVQRYDVAGADGCLMERYWRIINKPVFDQDGEVAYIINAAEDVTAQLKVGEMAERMKGMEQAERLFLQAPVAINILTGPDLVVKFTNKPSLEIWGKTEEEVLGKSLLDVLPELKSQGYRELLQQVRESHQPHHAYKMPVQLIREGKETVAYFNWVLQPYYEEDSTNAIGVVTFATEVTSYVEAEKKVEEVADRFHTLADQAPMMVFLANPDGAVTYWNRYWLTYTGQSFEQALGRTWEEVVHPADYPDLLQGYLAASEARQSYSIEARIRRWDGAYRSFLFTGGPRYDSNGMFLGNFGTGVDIHDRKAAEAALLNSEADLRNLILKAPVGICIVSGDPVSVEVTNDVFLELTGRQRQAFEQAPYWEVLKEAAAFYEPILRNVFETGIPYHGQEHEIMLIRNGKEEKVYITFTYDPIKGDDGTIQKVMILALDVTGQSLARRKIEETVKLRTRELAQANAALVESNLDLGRSNANLEEFAYAASHDLKEPIRKILFFTDRLKGHLQGRLDEEANRYFERLETGAKRMSTLIDDLLMYSHINRGATHLEKVNLGEVLSVVEEDLELVIKDKKATIIVEPLPTVTGHKRQLQQLFENLVGNALKYTKPGVSPQVKISSGLVKGKDIALQLKGEEGERQFHLIEVSDNGIGFDQEDAERIFNVFTRLHGNSEYKGTGVGLSIARKVAENHSGYVWAEGSPGEGATFKLLLPTPQNHL